MEVAVPSGCPGSEEVRREAERILGSAAAAGEPLTARGSVTRQGDTFTLELVIEREGARTERRLTARSCETAADVAALLIALAHQPDAVGQAPLEPPAPPVAPPPPDVAPSVPAAPPRAPPVGRRAPPPPPPGSLLGFSARAGPLFGVADLPFPQVGGQIAAALRIEAFTIELAFEAGFAATHIVEDRPDAGANFLRLAGVLRGCRVLVPFFSPPWPRPAPGVDFSACLGFEGGTLTGETFGVFRPEKARSVWTAPTLDLRLGIGVVRPLSLVPHVGLAFPIQRPSFVIAADELEPVLVHQPGPVAGRAGVHFELQF